MTQQPYYPPQPQQGPPPGYPQQPPPQQYQQPAPQQYAPPQYPQAPPQQPYAQPGYPPQQGYGAPPPAQPLAQGGLDEFYNQPSSGGGPSLGWTDKQSNQRPLGTTWIGTVVRDVTSADVQQQTSPQGVPQFFRDGRPKFAMKVPLKNVALVDPQGNYLQSDLNDGEGTWFCKGQARDELNRAMAEAGTQGAPKAGAVIAITLVQRRPTGGGMNPANVVQIRYGAGDGTQAAQPQQPAPDAPQAPQQQYQQPQVQGQPVQQPYPLQPQQGGPGIPMQELPPQAYAPSAQQLPPQAPQQQYQQPQGQPVPQQGAPVPPPGLSPQAQDLLNQLTGGQPAQ